MFTDNAYRADFAGNYTESFDADPVPDFDGMEYDDLRSGPKCADRNGNPCCCDPATGKFVGPGCRHCNPPDRECKPYGWGIETWDSPVVSRLRAELRLTALVTGLAWDQIRDHTPAWVGHSARRERHSSRVWFRLCDECETHTEAVERYGQWAERSATSRYRDEATPNVMIKQAARISRAA